MIVLIDQAASSAVSLEGQKCDEPKNVTTSFADGSSRSEFIEDNCDASKHLKCNGGRCGCKHPDLIFKTYTVSKDSTLNRRSKRSPKKGKGVSKGKAVAGGIGAAVVGGAVGYQLGKASQNNNGGGGGGGSYTSSSSSNNRPKEEKVIISSCFSRVGGDCALDRNKVVTVENTSTINNITTTVKTIKNYKEFPDCVLYAECKSKSTKAVGPDSDSNIGECVCRSGYDKTVADLCVKHNANGAMSTSGKAEIGMLILSLVMTMAIGQFKL